MFRVVLTQLLLFFLPFCLYAVWLWASKRSNHPDHWSKGPVAWLTLSGVVLVIIGFIVMATLEDKSEGRDFRPSEMRDGVFVPGRYE